MKIAIVMPVYNAGKYLQQTLNGIRNQSFEDWFLFIANDCSTDNTSEIIKKFSTENPEKVFVINSETNVGPAEARNLCLNFLKDWISTVTHISYCDSDDVWDSHHLQILYAYLTSMQVDIVYSDCRHINSNGDLVKPFGIPYYDEFNRSKLLEQNFIFMSSVLHKAEIAQKFSNDFVPVEDWEYWIRLTENSKVLHLQNTTFSYRWKIEGSYYTTSTSNMSIEKVKQKYLDDNSKFQLIEGWLSTIEGNALRSLSIEKTCLEIGSYKGKSASYIASVANSLTCIDTFNADFTGQNQQGGTLQDFKNNTKQFSNIVTVIGKSGDVYESIPDNSYDMIFIDGMHDYDSVKEDIQKYLPKLKDKGKMCFHDYQKDWPGVIQAVDEQFKGPEEMYDTIAVVTKGAKPKKTVVICPYSNKLPNEKNNPKNFPYWEQVVSSLKKKGIYIVQVGGKNEDPIEGVNEVRLGESFARLKEILDRSDTFICVDTFFQHFAKYHNRTGIVIFSLSDPEIFGHKENINLLKSKDYLRPNQFSHWWESEYNLDSFISADVVVSNVLRVLGLAETLEQKQT